MNINQIIEGWRNNIVPPSQLKKVIAKVSVERISICDDCEFHSKLHKTIRPDDHCTNCGCTLSAKTKCLSCACPLGKWAAVLTEDQEEKIENGK